MKRLGITAAALLLLVASASASMRIIDMPTEDLGTFYWTSTQVWDTAIDKIQPVIDAKDPYQTFFYAFRGLRYVQRTGDKAALKRVLEKLDYMLDEYQPAERIGAGVRWKYGHAFNEIPPNWWSGIDGFFGPMTLYAAWELSGVEKYKTAAIKSALLALRSPPDGGNLWRMDNGCWVSEFSWPGITQDQEYWVTNGQIIGLHALYILAEASDDTRLKDAYACARKGSEARAKIANEANPGPWPWYRLNPPTILPLNYLFFEANEYDAIARTTGDSFFAAEAKKRRDLIASRYTFALEKGDNGRFRLVESFIGAPHPYYPPPYAVEIICEHGADQKRIEYLPPHEAKEQLPFADRYTIDAELDWKPDRCSYTVIRGDFTYHVFDQDNFEIDDPAVQPSGATITPSLDAISWDGETAAISPSYLPDKVNTTSELNDQAYITLGFEWSDSDLLAMVIHPEVNTTLQFQMFDASGALAYRLYPEASASCDNIVMLSKDGFVGAEKLVGPAERVVLRLDTKNGPDFKLRLRDVAVLKNAAQIRTYLERHATACFRSETTIN